MVDEHGIGAEPVHVFSWFVYALICRRMNSVRSYHGHQIKVKYSREQIGMSKIIVSFIETIIFGHSRRYRAKLWVEILVSLSVLLPYSLYKS